MVRELFEMARSKKACIIFFDEIDAIGGARHDDGAGGDNEVQRTMLELINQLDGFDARGNIKVLMATNRYVPLCSLSLLFLAFATRGGELNPVNFVVLDRIHWIQHCYDQDVSIDESNSLPQTQPVEPTSSESTLDQCPSLATFVST